MKVFSNTYNYKIENFCCYFKIIVEYNLQIFNGFFAKVVGLLVIRFIKTSLKFQDGKGGN